MKAIDVLASHNLLTCLKHIKANGPMEESEGICGNMLLVADELQLPQQMMLARELDGMLLNWPVNAGKCRTMKMSYPVEGNRDYWKAVHERTLWQNPRRIALLDWLIKELEK